MIIERKKKGFLRNFDHKLTKNVPAIFPNLSGSDDHLIMQETDRFDAEIYVIPNGLEKYVAFTIKSHIFCF